MLEIKADRSYRTDEVARILGLGSVKTVRRMIMDINDPLPAFRLKRELRVPGKALLEYCERHKINPLNE